MIITSRQKMATKNIACIPRDLLEPANFVKCCKCIHTCNQKIDPMADDIVSMKSYLGAIFIETLG